MKKVFLPMAAGLLVLIGLLVGMRLFYRRSISEIEQISGAAEVFDRHYLLISGDRSELWQSVYENAGAFASETGNYLEWISPDEREKMSLSDCLRIGIASRVDGIILNPDGNTAVTELIDEAAESGIPVVTVLNDDLESQRISFVGINPYQMGEIYGEQVLSCLEQGENRILFLNNMTTDDASRNLSYSRMRELVERGRKKDQELSFSAYRIDTTSSFDAEETIRDIIVTSDEKPDILICPDPVSTECAYQAIVDYNEVGNVDIIGFYPSDTILDAIAKGLVPVTVSISVEELGRSSVEALNEYFELQYVSNYFSVGLNIITKENVGQFRQQPE